MRKGAPTIVLAGGCFDMLHYGHISFLQEAKSLGSKLIIALESDENVRATKGINRPIHSQAQRKAMLSALSCVDQIIELPQMKSNDEYSKLVESIHPDIIATTQGDPKKDLKENHALKIGARVIEIPKILTPSTSQLAKLLELE